MNTFGDLVVRMRLWHWVIIGVFLVSCKNEQAKNTEAHPPKGTFFIYGYGVVEDSISMAVARQKAFHIAQVYARITRFTWKKAGDMTLTMRKKAGVIMNNSGKEYEIDAQTLLRTHVIQSTLDPKIYYQMEYNPLNPRFTTTRLFGLNAIPTPAELFTEVVTQYVQSIQQESGVIEGDVFIQNLTIEPSKEVRFTLAIY
ncbi:MAG: hypothetical protein OCC49_06050 [Fibrobacterales bacterium]